MHRAGWAGRAGRRALCAGGRSPRMGASAHSRCWRATGMAHTACTRGTVRRTRGPPAARPAAPARGPSAVTVAGLVCGRAGRAAARLEGLVMLSSRHGHQRRATSGVPGACARTASPGLSLSRSCRGVYLPRAGEAWRRAGKRGGGCVGGARAGHGRARGRAWPCRQLAGRRGVGLGGVGAGAGSADFIFCLAIFIARPSSFHLPYEAEAR